MLEDIQGLNLLRVQLTSEQTVNELEDGLLPIVMILSKCQVCVDRVVRESQNCNWQSHRLIAELRCMLEGCLGTVHLNVRANHPYGKHICICVYVYMCICVYVLR